MTPNADPHTDLNAQIQQLIDGAPQDGQTGQVVKAIAPVLLEMAKQLGRDRYYVLQTLNGDWIRTTLSSRQKQGMEKSVVYAFPTIEDAAKSPGSPARDPQIMALPVPVVQILFQLMALKTVDSLVFFNQPGNVTSGTEVTREMFETLVRSYLQQVQQGPNVPPDLA